MKILFTTHHLINYSGTETFSLTLIKYLIKEKHQVYVYSKYQNDKITKEIEPKLSGNTTNLEDFKNINFDIIHIHHNINAYEIMKIFPNIPKIYLSHGIIPFLEKPPILLKKNYIKLFLGVSEEITSELENKYKIKNTTIFRNLIDTELFYERIPVNKKPKKALILSSRIDNNTLNIIKESLKNESIEYKIIGKEKIINYKYLPKEINKCDIVFSLGRGAMESMLCGRAVIIYDYQGGDGMVTLKNFYEILKNNFSGRRYKKQFSKIELIKEIKKYNIENITKIKEVALKEFSASIQTKKLLNLYNSIKNDKVEKSSSQKTDYINNLIWTNRHYSETITKEQLQKEFIKKIKKLSNNKNNLQKENKKLKSDLNKIQSSKTYKI